MYGRSLARNTCHRSSTKCGWWCSKRTGSANGYRLSVLRIPRSGADGYIGGRSGTMQYGLLFRIECLHAYFGGGPCRSLTLSPTDDCRRLMARYQMLFRGVGGGGAVYCPQQTPPDLLKQFDEIAAFTFTLISSDPAFNSYTEINDSELNIRESIFHFDNRKDYSEELFGQRRQLLHQPGKPFTQGALPVRPRV